MPSVAQSCALAPAGGRGGGARRAREPSGASRPLSASSGRPMSACEVQWVEPVIAWYRAICGSTTTPCSTPHGARGGPSCISSSWTTACCAGPASRSSEPRSTASPEVSPSAARRSWSSTARRRSACSASRPPAAPARCTPRPTARRSPAGATGGSRRSSAGASCSTATTSACRTSSSAGPAPTPPTRAPSRRSASRGRPASGSRLPPSRRSPPAGSHVRAAPRRSRG